MGVATVPALPPQTFPPHIPFRPSQATIRPRMMIRSNSYTKVRSGSGAALNYLRMTNFVQRLRVFQQTRAHSVFARANSVPLELPRADSVQCATFRILRLAKKECRMVRKKHGKRALAFHAQFMERKRRMTQSDIELSEKDMAELRAGLSTTDPNEHDAVTTKTRRRTLPSFVAIQSAVDSAAVWLVRDRGVKLSDKDMAELRPLSEDPEPTSGLDYFKCTGPGIAPMVSSRSGKSAQ